MGLPPELIEQQVERIAGSGQLARSAQLVRLLRFLVEKARHGHGGDLKESVIGIEVFERGSGFDPRLDSIVRVQAGKLRARLKAYYAGPGKFDPLIIDLPKGRYLPQFQLRTPAAVPPSTPSRRRWPGALAAAAVVLVAAMWLWARRHDQAPAPRLEIHQQTFDPGLATDPAPSRDGKLLAFSSYRGGQTRQIWLQRTDSREQAIQLTSHPSVSITPDFAPDANTIAFRSSRDGGGLYALSLFDRKERKLTDGGFAPRYSPDGQWIAYSAIEESGNAAIYVVPASGGTPARVNTQAVFAKNPVWTPDGQGLVFLGSADGSSYDWWVVRSFGNGRFPSQNAIQTGASEVAARQGLSHFEGAAPAPEDWIGDQLLFTRRENLWRMRLSPRTFRAMPPAVQVHPGPGVRFPRVSHTPRGPRVTFAVLRDLTRLTELPVDPGVKRPTRYVVTDSTMPGGLTFEAMRPNLSRDGRKVVYHSRASGSVQLWMKDLETGGETSLLPQVSAPQWRPFLNATATDVLYMLGEQDRLRVERFDLAGGARQRICEDCGELLDRSPDGRLALLRAGRALSLLDVEMGRRRTLIDDQAIEPMQAALSPDGKWVALAAGVKGTRMLQGVLVPIQDAGNRSQWRPVVEEEYDLCLRWSTGGDRLYYFHTSDGFRCLYSRRIGSDGRPAGPAVAMHHFHTQQRYPWGGSWISAAADKLVVVLSEAQGNLYYADLPRIR